ncbi:MAG: hypothetical protein IPJ50_01130 [Betaproteobacteria bacterium]|nr:hypothetical protein [Betaproteobacteria bacterium]
MQNKISHGELVLLYKDADVPSISGLAEKKMPQYSRDLAHGLLHARDAVSNETVTPGLPNARALGTGAKVKILRESDMGKREQGKALGRRDALLHILKPQKKLPQAATVNQAKVSLEHSEMAS